MIFQEFQDFSRKLGFSRKSSFFKDFAIWAGTKARPACRLEGVGGRVGIGPQGRESVLRHSARARGIVGIDSGGLETHQVTPNRNSEIFQKVVFFKKMSFGASEPQNLTHMAEK